MNTGHKAESIGPYLASFISLTPDEKVIVHHYTDYPDKVQLEIEVRSPAGFRFERVILNAINCK